MHVGNSKGEAREETHPGPWDDPVRGGGDRFVQVEPAGERGVPEKQQEQVWMAKR